MSSEDYKALPVTVDKPIPVNYDLGNLTVFDSNVIEGDDFDTSNADREENIKKLTRDNVQLLINQILSLPMKTTTESVGGSGDQSASVTLLQLPEPISDLPREKPLPKPKPPTKWEKFAAKKGIQPKAKSGKTVYDEASGEWVPKWGYKGKNQQLDDQWLVEIEDSKKGTEEELLDPRSLNRSKRKNLIRKNERQQKKNLKNGQGLN